MDDATFTFLYGIPLPSRSRGGLTNAEYQARWRARQREQGVPWSQIAPRSQAQKRAHNRRKEAKRRAFQLAKPFKGVDGEGCGTDATGRQHYMLLCAGDAELYTGEPLTTVQCLDHLLDNLPPTSEAISVGFSFGYDITMMICRDLPPERQKHLLQDAKPGRKGVTRWTFWNPKGTQGHGYALQYLHRNFFRIDRKSVV